MVEKYLFSLPPLPTNPTWHKLKENLIVTQNWSVSLVFPCLQMCLFYTNMNKMFLNINISPLAKLQNRVESLLAPSIHILMLHD